MRFINDFDLKAICKSESKNYTIVDKDILEDYAYYVFTIEYEGIEIYFLYEIDKYRDFAIEDLLKSAESAINNFEEMSKKINKKKRYEYLLQRSWLIYADFCTRQRGLFSEKTERRIASMAEELINAYPYDFAKVYKEFATKYTINEILYL